MQSTVSEQKGSPGSPGVDRPPASNDFATEAVPASKRSSVWVLSMQLAGVAICISGLFGGAAVARGLPVSQVVLAALAGNAILTIYGGLVGAIGTRTGLSTTLLSRRCFGESGSAFVSFVAAVTLVGWYAVQVGFFGRTINAMCPTLGPVTSVSGAALWGGLLMMVTAYFGYRGLSILSAVAVPVVLLMSSWGLYQAVSATDVASYLPQDGFSLAKGITMVVGGFAVGAVLQSDLTRYARSERDSWIATICGFIFANSYIMLAGALTSIATSSGDLPRAMLALGMGAPALIVLVLAQWTTNDNNLYSASLAVANVFAKVKKGTTVIVLGVIATLLGVAGFADGLVTWLTYLGILIPPIAGVIIADFWVLGRREVQQSIASSLWGCNPSAFLAWFAGATGGFMIGWGIPALNSILISVLVYVLVDSVTTRFFASGTSTQQGDPSG